MGNHEIRDLAQTASNASSFVFCLCGGGISFWVFFWRVTFWEEWNWGRGEPVFSRIGVRGGRVSPSVGGIF